MTIDTLASYLVEQSQCVTWLKLGERRREVHLFFPRRLYRVIQLAPDTHRRISLSTLCQMCAFPQNNEVIRAVIHNGSVCWHARKKGNRNAISSDRPSFPRDNRQPTERKAKGRPIELSTIATGGWPKSPKIYVMCCPWMTRVRRSLDYASKNGRATVPAVE